MQNMSAVGVLPTLLAVVVVGANAEAQTFRWAFQGDVQTMDPHALAETMTLSFQGNIYEGLVRRDARMKLVGALAERWEHLQPRVWRFYLRRNVRFHDGSAFRADDVRFSVERASAKSSGMRSAASVMGSVRVVDPYTVEFETPRPNPILPQQLELIYMMDRQWSQRHGASAVAAIGREGETSFTHMHANGTGPFKLKDRAPGTKTVLVRHRGYWEEIRSNIDVAEFTPIANDATRVAALISGNVHMAYPIPVQDWTALQRSSKTRPLTGPEARTIFLGFDQSREELAGSNIKGRNPFKDVRVREAFMRAIDVEAINHKIMRGTAVPAGLMVAPQINGYSSTLNKRPAYDPNEARALLRQAGYADGFDVTMDCPNDRYVNDERICRAIATMLARINVRVKLLAQTKSKFFAKILSHNGYDTSFFMLGWTPSTFDSHNPIASVMSCRGQGDGLGQFNIGGYCNLRINALAAKIQAESDQAIRQAMIDEAFRIHKDEVGHIPLHQQPLSWGVAADIQLVQRPDNIFSLRYVTMGPGVH